MSGNKWLVLLMGVAMIWGGAGCSTQSPSGGGSTDIPDIPTEPDESVVAAARELEEADIIKQDGDYLYLANPYLGFRIIDASEIDHPVLAGSIDTSGRAVELYAYNDHAYMICTSDYYSCAGEPVDFDSSDSPFDPGYEGSRLYVFDTSDPYDPSVETIIPIAGSVTATRRVGNFLYVAGNALPDVYGTDEASSNGSLADSNGVDNTEQDVAYAVSFNLTAADGVQETDRETWYGLADEIHATDESMYVIGDDPDMDDTSLVTFLDISSPSGLVSMRDRFRVPGHIRNRFFVDEYEHVFRVITAEQVDSGGGIYEERTCLYTYDVSNPEIIERIARLPIDVEDDVWGVRFDGTRGYVATYYSSGPLWVLDLSDPENPQVSGDISKPGISTHLVPMGDRLLAIGFDPARYYRPVVSMYNVENSDLPRLLDRVTIETPPNLLSDISSEAYFDEKALSVLMDEGLVLFPFSYQNEMLDWIDAIELIQIQENGMLAERDSISHRGLIRRSGILDTRLWILSDIAFQVVNMDVLNELESIDTLDIISDQELLDAGLSDCVDSARYHANPITQWYDYLVDYPMDWGFACGAMSPALLTALLVGMITWKTTRKRQ